MKTVSLSDLVVFLQDIHPNHSLLTQKHYWQEDEKNVVHLVRQDKKWMCAPHAAFLDPKAVDHATVLSVVDKTTCTKCWDELRDHGGLWSHASCFGLSLFWASLESYHAGQDVLQRLDKGRAVSAKALHRLHWWATRGGYAYQDYLDDLGANAPRDLPQVISAFQALQEESATALQSAAQKDTHRAQVRKRIQTIVKNRGRGLTSGPPFTQDQLFSWDIGLGNMHWKHSHEFLAVLLAWGAKEKGLHACSVVVPPDMAHYLHWASLHATRKRFSCQDAPEPAVLEIARVIWDPKSGGALRSLPQAVQTAGDL